MATTTAAVNGIGEIIGEFGIMTTNTETEDVNGTSRLVGIMTTGIMATATVGIMNMESDDRGN